MTRICLLSVIQSRRLHAAPFPNQKGGSHVTNIEIVHELVRNGYHLMNRSAEQMAADFTNEQLRAFLEHFTERRITR